MTSDDDIVLNTALNARERALAVHEAGRAVVAHTLGADVLFLEINVATGSGEVRRSSVFADNVKNLAVCVAGYKAELAFAADELRLSKMLTAHAMRTTRDYQQMQELLSLFPDVERFVALVEGFRLADVALKAKSDLVHKIAHALSAQRFADEVRIEGATAEANLHCPRAPPVRPKNFHSILRRQRLETPTRTERPHHTDLLGYFLRRAGKAGCPVNSCGD